MARAGDEAAPGDPVEVALVARVAELGHGLQLCRPAPGPGPRRGEVDVVLTAAGALFHFLQTINKHGLFNYMDPRTHSSYALNIPCPPFQINFVSRLHGPLDAMYSFIRRLFPNLY